MMPTTRTAVCSPPCSPPAPASTKIKPNITMITDPAARPVATWPLPEIKTGPPSWLCIADLAGLIMPRNVARAERLPGLDRHLVAFMGDFAGHAASFQLVAGLLRVVVGVEVNRDVVPQQAELIEFVKRGSQQRGVVPVRGGEYPAQRDAPRFDGSRAIFFSSAKMPALIHSSRRSRIVVAPQVQSAIDTYEQPKRRTWMSFSKMIRSPTRGRWQPSGWDGA